MNTPVGQASNRADTNHDGAVDISDLVAVAVRFGQTNANPAWDASADMVGNGVIDIYDVVYVASRFN